MDGLTFEVQATDPSSNARAGLMSTPHGEVMTPVFMPVGTRASVKGLLPDQLRDAGVSILLANTYHLALRPGENRVARLGGLSRFMDWDRPILTDSGGFQIFSLEGLRRLDDQGVSFRSHLDGSWLTLTPERAIDIQEKLGADLIMCLDECPPATAHPAEIDVAVDRTTRWARRCQDAHRRPGQSLFAIVQGGTNLDARARSAEQLVTMRFEGYAIGGLSVGESHEAMYRVLSATTPLLPVDRPRYLMGVGTPANLLEGIERGVDMFDCVMPTRNGRNATAFTSRGVVKLRNAIHADDERPLDSACSCLACRRFSRAYLRHLFQVDEMLGPILVSLHNVSFYCGLMRGARRAIELGEFAEYKSRALAAMESTV